MAKGRKFSLLPEDSALFRQAVGEIRPLANDKIHHEPPPPPARALQHERDEHDALIESLHQPLSIEARLEGGDEPNFLRDGLPRNVIKDLRRGRWVVQDQIDLHGATRVEARDWLVEFLARNLVLGKRCVRVIHGKGLGSPGREPVLKGLVRSWLSQRDEVLAFCQARPVEGGEGALIVLLRGTKSRPG